MSAMKSTDIGPFRGLSGHDTVFLRVKKKDLELPLPKEGRSQLL
jgi:hypothetical protein